MADLLLSALYYAILAYSTDVLWPYGKALLTFGAKFLLFWQPYFYSSTMRSTNDGAEFLKFLIQDAKLKFKLGLVLLPLAFTTMQIFSHVGGGTSLLIVILYMVIMTSFLSIALHIIAILCYEAILHNPTGLDALMSHAHEVLEMPLSLDPWVAFSIPSTWTFSSFFLFFIALIVTALETDITTTEANYSSRCCRMEALGCAIATLLFGLMNGAVFTIIWRKYISMPLSH